MWTRAELKKKAKEALKGAWLRAVLVVFLGMILTGGAGAGFGSAGSGMNQIVNKYNEQDVDQVQTQVEAVMGELTPEDEMALGVILVVLGFVLVIAILIGILYSTFIGNVVDTGMKNYFIRNREEHAGIGLLFSGFDQGYLNVVKTRFFVSLKCFLGFLLLFVPGIIWSYSYAMVPYILAENPTMDSKEVQKMSAEMMQGNKWRLFVLQLSFLGWGILCIFTLGIGNFFLSAYEQATEAELYVTLRDKMNGTTQDMLVEF